MARIKPASFLGGESFEVFKQAISGAHWDRKRRMNIASIDHLPRIVRQLGRAGFVADVDEVILAELGERRTQSWMKVQAIRERVDHNDQEFQEREGKSFFPFQRTDIVWLAQRHGALMLHEMRLGKTMMALTALPAGAPTLVVCPASVKGVWVGQARTFRPQIKTTVLEGRDSFRWPNPGGGEMVILNYDILPDVHDRDRCDGYLPAKPCTGCREEYDYSGPEVKTTYDGHLPTCTGELARARCPGCHPILNQAPPGVVEIYDEAHRIKNRSSKRTISAGALADAGRSVDGYVWLLTGTPLENTPPELWTIMQIAGVASEAFPGGWKEFAEAFGGALESRGSKHFYVWKDPKPEAAEGIRKIARRRLRSQVWAQLPAKTWNRIVVPIDRAVLEKAEIVTQRAGGLERLLAMLEKDKPELGDISRMREELASAKIPFLLEYLKDREVVEPVVVFSMHRRPIDLLARKKGWASIVGGMKSSLRTEIVRSFQAGELVGVACTIQAAGEGLDLSIASEAIFVDLSYKPTANAQAEDRLVHVERPRKLLYTIFEADHVIDRRTIDICMRKRKLIVSTVDASSVTEDVGTIVRDPAVAELARLAAEELARDPSTRRRQEGVCEVEFSTVAALHDLTFDDLGRDRLAADLAEELEIVGLTDKQWRLAGELIASAARPTAIVQSSMGNGEPTMPKREERKLDPELEEIRARIKGLTNEQRQELFGGIYIDYCTATGIDMTIDLKHLCDACDDEDEDDEDDDDDGEDDDDDDDDAESDDDADDEPESGEESGV